MKILKVRSKNNLLLFLFCIVIVIQNKNCIPLHNEEPVKLPDIIKNEAKYKNISSLYIKGNITIYSPDKKGKLYAGFVYKFPDSLRIQLRDPIGRKQALLSFMDEEFELWLQRENRKLGRDELSDDFSLFVFNQLKLKEIRRLFLGRPLFNASNPENLMKKNSVVTNFENTTNLISFFNNDGTIHRVEISTETGEKTSVFYYSNWQVTEGVIFPGDIEIIDLKKEIHLKIKLYHYLIEYYNLSS